MSQSQSATSEAAATRATVDEFLRRLAEGSPDDVAAVYAESVDWQLNWPVDSAISESVPWIRQRTTRAQVAEHYRLIASSHDPVEPGTSIDSVLVDGAAAVVFGTIRLRARRTGESYAARFALRLRVEDGLITQHHVYEDTLSVATAWNGTPEEWVRNDQSVAAT